MSMLCLMAVVLYCLGNMDKNKSLHKFNNIFFSLILNAQIQRGNCTERAIKIRSLLFPSLSFTLRNRAAAPHLCKSYLMVVVVVVVEACMSVCEHE